MFDLLASCRLWLHDEKASAAACGVWWLAVTAWQVRRGSCSVGDTELDR